MLTEPESEFFTWKPVVFYLRIRGLYDGQVFPGPKEIHISGQFLLWSQFHRASRVGSSPQMNVDKLDSTAISERNFLSYDAIPDFVASDLEITENW